MEHWRRRIGLAAIALVGIVFAYTLVYRWAMGSFEGQERTFLDSLQIVVESLTTAGFGGDTDHWTTPQLNLLVIAMNLTGVLLVFLAIPLFAVPMFREAFYTKPPESSTLTDHVIICGHSRRDEVLCGELDEAGIPYLYIDTDPDVVRSLLDRDIPAIVGDSERVETLHAANVGEARAVVADINDEINPTVILSVKRANPHVRVLSVARREGVADYHRYAGAEEVIEAPHVLGESLALRAVSSFAEKFRDSIDHGAQFEISELLIEEGSELIGQTLRGTDVFGEQAIQVIGGWFGGRFRISPDPDMELVENTILLISGHYELPETTTRRLPGHLDGRSRVLVCGYGVVGRAAVDMLEKHGANYDVVDRDPSLDPDYVGDVTDPQTFIGADVGEYRTIVLALDEDTTTIYATLVLDRMAPHVEIVARVHNPDNVWKLYSAGADFVLSMSALTGEMLAAELIDEMEILTAHDEFEFARVDVGGLVGREVADANIRSRTGCSIVAVDREGEVITDIHPGFVFEADDEVILAGSADALERFDEHFGT